MEHSSTIFLPSKELSKVYTLLTSLRTNPNSYLVNHIIPNASSFPSHSLKSIISFLKNKPPLPALKHNTSLFNICSSYLQYLILTHNTSKMNPHFSLEHRIRSLGLYPYQYKEIVLKYTSPHSTVCNLLLNEHFRDFLMSPSMHAFSMAIDTLPNGEHCIMVNIAGEGSSSLIRNSNVLSLSSFTPIRKSNKALSMSCSEMRRECMDKRMEDGKRRKVDRVLYGDDEVYVCDKGRKRLGGWKRGFLLRKGEVEKVDCVQGYNMYVVTKKYKREGERNKWLMDFNKDVSVDNWGRSQKKGHRHTFTSYY